LDSPGQTGALTIRAHHLVCLAHYVVFHDEHPTLVVLWKAMQEDPDRAVRVVVGPDDVCAPCPHWNGSECNRRPGMEEKNRVKDAAFLKALGFTEGESTTVREAYRVVAGRVTLDVLKAICPGCNPDECAEAVARWPWER
jgi:hypothetical protein